MNFIFKEMQELEDKVCECNISIEILYEYFLLY